MLNKIPLEERRIIDELVDFWQTRYEPRDLITHLDRLSSSWGSGAGASFFRQVYEDVRSGKRSKYTASSASEFKQFLEIEYSRQVQIHVEHKAQAKAKAEADRQAWMKAETEHKVRERAEAERKAQEEAKRREGDERRARADFDALGKQMAKATTRAELVKLGQKRADLAPLTGVSYVYKNHCWKCPNSISSDVHAQCPICTYYICSSCGSCLCGFLNNREREET